MKREAVWKGHAGGKVGAKKAEQKLPSVLAGCINLIRPLPEAHRTRVLCGIRAFILEDVLNTDSSELS